MAFTTRLAHVRDQSKYFNERTWMCSHQVPPLVRVVAHVGDARQAKSHFEHNPLSLLRTCYAMPLRKLNDPGRHPFPWRSSACGVYDLERSPMSICGKG